MGEPFIKEFEAFVLHKAWMPPDRLAGLLDFYRLRVGAGEKAPLADLCVTEGYLTADQVAELTAKIKIPMACPACAGRFKVGGKRPASGWTCPRCKAPLEAVVEVGVELIDTAPPPPAPAAVKPDLRRPRGRARGKEEEKEPPPPGKKSPLVLVLSVSGGAAVLLVGVLLLLSSGSAPAPQPEPSPRPVVIARPAESETALREEWARASEAVEAARKEPWRIAATLPLLEGIAQRARGTEIETKALAATTELRALVPAPADQKIASEVRELVDAGQLGGAMNLIRGYLSDKNTSPALARSLETIRGEIATRAVARYEILLREARVLADAGDPWKAKSHLLQAAAFGVPDVEERARKEADGFMARVRSKPVEAPPASAEDPITAPLAKLEADLARLEGEGRLGEAIAACEDFVKRFPDATQVRQRLEEFRTRLAAAVPAPAPEPDRKTQAAAAPGLAIVSPRGPRPGEFKPGGLSDADKKKKFSELSGEAKKEKKGAAKAAAAKRAEWLAGLEKEMGIYDVATIQDKGDVARRVDIVIVSSGFSRADAKKVNQMAESLKVALLKVDPFQNYPDYINFHRINVDDKGTHEKARIPFQVQTDILTASRAKAIEYARVAPSFDLVVVLCNVANVRATGGPPIITIDASLDMGRTFLHEMGHAFASLSDEYVDTGLAPGRPFNEDEDSDWLTNVTSQPNPKLAKWHYWIPGAWPAPHEMNRLPGGHKVGCFEGAAYQSKGVFRPEETCLMRTGDRYCVVCFEHVEKRFYRLIAPIDDARPRRPVVGLWSDETVVLEADALRTAASGRETIGKFEGFWFVDGKLRHGNAKNLTTALTVQGSELGAGVHEAGLRVDFSNKRVRRDQGWLSSSIGWKLDVVKHKKPKWEGPAGLVQGRVGQPVGFDMKIENPDPQLLRVEVHDMPEGASYEDGKFAWTPRKEDQGGWRPRFVLTDGLRTVEKSVDLAVLDVTEKNFEPVFSPMEARALTEGEELELPLEVADVDGDNLVFTSPNLPEGAVLDPYAGVLRWRPSLRQAGRYPGIVVEVFDGRRKVKGAVDLVVDDQPRFDPLKEDLLNALRSASPSIRERALKGLGSYARIFQCLEAARLLRDKDKEVRGAALSVLRGIADSADAAMLAMIVSDLEPHAWHFTDDKEILAWLESLAGKAPANDADARKLRAALKGISKYNKDRGI